MVTTDLQALGGGRVRGHLERSGGSSSELCQVWWFSSGKSKTR